MRYSQQVHAMASLWYTLWGPCALSCLIIMFAEVNKYYHCSMHGQLPCQGHGEDTNMKDISVTIHTEGFVDNAPNDAGWRLMVHRVDSDPLRDE